MEPLIRLYNKPCQKQKRRNKQQDRNGALQPCRYVRTLISKIETNDQVDGGTE